MSTPLSDPMLEAMQAMGRHGHLVRWKWGWTYAGVTYNRFGGPDWVVGNSAMGALVRRGLACTSEPDGRGVDQKASLTAAGAKRVASWSKAA